MLRIIVEVGRERLAEYRIFNLEKDMALSAEGRVNSPLAQYRVEALYTLNGKEPAHIAKAPKQETIFEHAPEDGFEECLFKALIALDEKRELDRPIPYKLAENVG